MAAAAGRRGNAPLSGLPPAPPLDFGVTAVSTMINQYLPESRTDPRMLALVEEEDFAAEVENEIRTGEVMIDCANSTLQRYEDHLDKMARFTATVPEVKAWSGREFERGPGLLDMTKFFKYYIAMRLRTSAKTSYELNVKNEMEKVKKYCKPSTLYNYAADIAALAAKYAKLDTKELHELRSSLDCFVAGLSKKYGLKDKPAQKVTLYKPDARLLIQEEMKDPVSIDVALQFCNLTRLLAVIGSRPCGLFVTKAYDKFIKIGDFELYRMKEDGKTIGFSMDLTLKNFKGFQKDREHEVPVCLVSPENRFNLDFDVPTNIVAQLFRRGAFGIKTAAEVYDDPGIRVEIDPTFLSQPLFLKIQRKGVGLVSTEGVETWKDVAMYADGVNDQIARRCKKLGLGQSTSGVRPSVYSFRRAVATDLAKNTSQIRTQTVLGHQHSGFALQRHYDQGMRQFNLSAATMRGEKQELPTQNYSKEYLRAVRETLHKPASVHELMDSDATLLELGRLLGVLKECWKRGTHEWLNLEQFASKDPCDIDTCMIYVQRAFETRLNEVRGSRIRQEKATIGDGLIHMTHDELENKRLRYEEGNSSVSKSLHEMHEGGRRQARKLIAEANEDRGKVSPTRIMLDGDSEDGDRRAEVGSVGEEDADELNAVGLDGAGQREGSNDKMDVDACSDMQTLDGEEAVEEVTKDTVAVEKEKNERVKQWTTDVSRAETRTTYAEVREERRKDFVVICELANEQDQSCRRCATDPTVTSENRAHQYTAKQFESHGFESHGGTLFHSARNEYLRYLTLTPTTKFSYPKAFSSILPRSRSDVSKQEHIVCPYCDDYIFGYRYMTPLGKPAPKGVNGFFYHLKEEHFDEVPEKYRFGLDNTSDPGNDDFAKRQAAAGRDFEKAKAKKASRSKKDDIIIEAGELVYPHLHEFMLLTPTAPAMLRHAEWLEKEGRSLTVDGYHRHVEFRDAWEMAPMEARIKKMESESGR
ncbi:hypothetical protein QFC24_002151 [Naganishia onofrii]|uniref:Uncharacterized protein n=1 Tax=Naganishia onofrii TaxID=1851511 RepID=A0ACC2XR11_9TREE|nr:hypothetical protein QFC24_002151 [Naganishia onofrii]